MVKKYPRGSGKVTYLSCPFCQKALAGTDRWTEIFSSHKKKELEEHMNKCEYRAVN